MVIDMSLLDVDECVESTDDCEHRCLNNDGSFSCTCHIGYRIDANGHTCNGITNNYGSLNGLYWIGKNWYELTLSSKCASNFLDNYAN